MALTSVQLWTWLRSSRVWTSCQPGMGWHRQGAHWSKAEGWEAHCSTPQGSMLPLRWTSLDLWHWLRCNFNMGRSIRECQILRRSFWNNTYQAVHFINGSDWAENANWLYVEYCTGEKELCNSGVDLQQVYNKTDSIYKIVAWWSHTSKMGSVQYQVQCTLRCALAF